LEKVGEDARAVAEGRVFVGRMRVASAGEVVRVGDEVRIGASAAGHGARAGTGTGTRETEGWEILWERDGLVACVKPAGMPTVPDHLGASHALVAVVAGADWKDGGGDVRDVAARPRGQRGGRVRDDA